MGYKALWVNTTASNNTAVGRDCLRSNTTGSNNTTIGMEAGYAINTGTDNTGVGYGALQVTTGLRNTALGSRAMQSAVTGNNNVGLGYIAMGSVTSGAQNVGVGNDAGNNITTGSYNNCLGYNSQPPAANSTNTTTLGNSGVANLRCNDTSISSLSDSRDKTNIVDIPLGLSFINTVRPVAFDWDRRDGSFEGRKDFGFIAQELKTAADATDYADHMRLVHDENPDKLEADPMKMFPILVKAIQELKAENDALKTRVTTLEG